MAVIIGLTVITFSDALTEMRVGHLQEVFGIKVRKKFVKKIFLFIGFLCVIFGILSFLGIIKIYQGLR